MTKKLDLFTKFALPSCGGGPHLAVANQIQNPGHAVAGQQDVQQAILHLPRIVVLHYKFHFGCV